MGRIWKDRVTENQRPDFFPPTQHYVVFEFTDGGTDLENFQFRNAAQVCVLDLFLLLLFKWKRLLRRIFLPTFLKILTKTETQILTLKP